MADKEDRLLHYTPLGTVIRLITINVVNVYFVCEAIHLCGGYDDARSLLPAWVAVASVRKSLNARNYSLLFELATRYDSLHGMANATTDPVLSALYRWMLYTGPPNAPYRSLSFLGSQSYQFRCLVDRSIRESVNHSPSSTLQIFETHSTVS